MKPERLSHMLGVRPRCAPRQRGARIETFDQRIALAGEVGDARPGNGARGLKPATVSQVCTVALADARPGNGARGLKHA